MGFRIDLGDVGLAGWLLRLEPFGNCEATTRRRITVKL